MAYRSKAEIEFYLGNFEQMLKDGERALELSPNDSEVIWRSFLYNGAFRMGLSFFRKTKEKI